MNEAIGCLGLAALLACACNVREPAPRSPVAAEQGLKKPAPISVQPALTCAADRADCDGDVANGCEASLRDAAHCGACDKTCAPAQTCASGECSEARVTLLKSGDRIVCAARGSLDVICWGMEARTPGLPRRRAMPPPRRMLGLADVKALGVYESGACAVEGSGRVKCWYCASIAGCVNATSLPDPNNPVVESPASSPPAQLGSIDDAVDLAGGGEHMCLVRANGHVLCWGGNQFGELGDGSRDYRDAPVAVHGIDDAVEVALGYSHSCARQKTGGVSCWGRNMRGQLGDGTQTDRTVPVRVKGVEDAVGIAAGLQFSCALKRGGTVACWGYNDLGQLGDGTGVPHLTARIIPNLQGVVQISSGQLHTCARQDSGDVRCWGGYVKGQRQPDSPAKMEEHARTPMVVVGLGRSTLVAAGAMSCAAGEDGRVRCWGLDVDDGRRGGLAIIDFSRTRE